MRPAQLGLAVVALAAVAACSKGTGSTRRLSPEAQLGREVFLEKADPACGTCHTLRDAGSASTIGPDLDELRPSFEEVRTAVIDGVGAMPSQTDLLTQVEIEAVARYVTEVAGQGEVPFGQSN